jgi:hypothetical protein
VKFWKNMKLEFTTHYRSEETGCITVIAKSKISHRKTKWNKFLRLVNGNSLEIYRIRRYKTPIHELKDTPASDEVHSNIFTIDMNDDRPDESVEDERSPKKKSKSKGAKKSKNEPTRAIVRLLEKDVASGKVLPSSLKRGALHKTTLFVFGQDWSRGNCVDLRVFWLLEVHRRILALEHFMEARGVTRRLPELRAHALSARKYILLDPVTLALPMLLGHLRGSFDIQADATYRLLAVTASLGPLLKYGVELTAVARGHLSNQHLAEASPFLFSQPFAFLPESMRGALDAASMANAPASIARRIEKEQASAHFFPLLVPRGCALTDRNRAGRRAGAGAHQGDQPQQLAAQDVHADPRARPRAARGGLARQGVHAPPAPDAQHAGRRVRPARLPGPDPRPVAGGHGIRRVSYQTP